MKIFRLASVGALALATALALPVAAEAGHRHSRSCGHDSYYGGSYRDGRYDRYNNGYGRYDNGYGRYDESYGRYGYDNDYGRRHCRPYRRHGYGHSYYSYEPYGYYAPPPVYYAPRYHRRPRVRVHLGFGY
jgi:hypothetical protein